MNILGFPWEQYAVIVELAIRMLERGERLGKTALQKYVYLLQTVYGIDCDYDFPLYTYGPFSTSLLGDLDAAEGLQGVTVKYLRDINGYEILPGPKADVLKSKAREFLEGASPAIDRLLEEFGGFNARELELRATIVFADRDTRRKGGVTEDEIVRIVHRIKPHFSQAVIRDAVRELAQAGHVRLN
jgi:hypothetical protein